MALRTHVPFVTVNVQWYVPGCVVDQLIGIVAAEPVLGVPPGFVRVQLALPPEENKDQEMLAVKFPLRDWQAE